MKKFIQKMKNLWRSIVNMVEAIDVIVQVAAVVFLFFFTLHHMQPMLSWAVTTVFFVVGTVIAFGRKLTAMMSAAGLILYIASWYVARRYGVWPGLTCWAVGMMVWFYALILSIADMTNQHSTQAPKPATR